MIAQMIPRGFKRVAIVVLALLAALSPLATGVDPVRAQSAGDERSLDLPAMTLTPADLEEAGFEHYRLNFGVLLGADEAVAAIAEDQDVRKSEVRDLFEETGFARWYESALYLRPDEEDLQGEVDSIVRSYVLEFADEAGAADAWEFLEDESADDTAKDIGRVESFGDASEATRYRTGDIEAIDLTFRLGNLHGGVLLVDRTGGTPATDDVEALAALLIGRIERVLDEGGPGLSGRTLRLTGDEVEASVDNYLLIDGEAIHFYHESEADLRGRESEAEEFGQTDEYDVWQLLSPLGAGLEDDVWYFVAVSRFADEETASDWLAGIEARVEDNDGLAGFEIDESAPVFGDQSVTYTVEQVEHPIAYRNLSLRVENVVADISLQGPEAPDVDVVEEVAGLQTRCLEAGGCFEPQEVPDGLVSYIGDIEEESNGRNVE
jgi:hypothetical protein